MADAILPKGHNSLCHAVPPQGDDHCFSKTQIFSPIPPLGRLCLRLMVIVLPSAESVSLRTKYRPSSGPLKSMTSASPSHLAVALIVASLVGISLSLPSMVYLASSSPPCPALKASLRLLSF